MKFKFPLVSLKAIREALPEKPEVQVQLIKFGEKCLFVFLLAGGYWLFRDEIKLVLLPKITGVKVLGFQASFETSIDKAAESMQGLSAVTKVKHKITDEEKMHTFARAEMQAKALRNAQILWLDPHPDNNREERAILRQLGVFVDLAKTCSEAFAMAQKIHYDVIITNRTRRPPKNPNENLCGENIDPKVSAEDDHEAGSRFLWLLRTKEVPGWRRTILYTSEPDILRYAGEYQNFFGITNRPDELLHLIMDGLERDRSYYGSSAAIAANLRITPASIIRYLQLPGNPLEIR